MAELPLLITLDVECDKTPTWRTAPRVENRGVTEGIARILTPILERWGVAPTYLVSAEVLTDPASVEVLVEAPRAELGTHLHHEYVAPQVPTWAFGGTLASGMQRELPPALEREKLETLTALFAQVTGRRPTSFRAGRFGAGPATAGILAALGYRVDSSVTPHVCWTTASGAPVPDYRHAPERPYRIAADGDLTTPGDGPLLEVPLTILPPATAGGEPRWFRPWFSQAEELERIVAEVAAMPAVGGIRRPLVMMFHSCELVPGGSPYPQHPAEVERFTAQLERAIAAALDAGAVPMTLTEYAARIAAAPELTAPAAAAPPALRLVTEAPPATPPALDSVTPYDADDALAIPQAAIDAAVAQAQAQPWFAYSIRERQTRWELWEVVRWMRTHLPRDARILSSGCGIGANLFALHRHGFTRLEGFDIDERAVNAGQRLAEGLGDGAIRLWTDDGLRPLQVEPASYDAIEAMNWVMLVPGIELGTLLADYATLLRTGGVLFLDVIDAAYNAMPGNEWHTADRALPEHARRPSEYKLRASLADVRRAAAAAGLEVVGTFARPQQIPKVVYVLRRVAAAGAPARRPAPRPDRPRLKLIADVPNWIFERHARTLQRLLAPDFRIEVGFRDERTDEDEYDLVYPLEFNLYPLNTIRRPEKFVTGIRSHVSWEGFRPEAVGAVLRTCFAATHVVSRRLHDLFAPHVPGLAIVAHGIDTGFFTPSAPSARRLPTLRVGWAGNRRTPTKNFDALIAPIGRLAGVELAFCGYADRNLGINEMREWYDTLDVFVHASGTEGHNNALMEAAAMGRAIVTTDAGTVPEWLEDGRHALLVPRDAGAITAAIERLRDDPALRERLGRAARAQVVARWDWAARAADYRTFFRAALEGRALVPAGTGVAA